MQANNIEEHKLPKFQCRVRVSSHPPLLLTPQIITLPQKCMTSNVLGKMSVSYIAYQDNPTFIFHKLQHHNFHACHNAIHCQNTYLVNQWVVPLEGISSDLAINIEEIPRVHDIQTHKLTRWYNVITNKKWFASVTEMIQNNLQGCVGDIQSKHDINLQGLPPANVKQKSTNKEHESEHSGSYLSACSSVFTFEEGSPRHLRARNPSVGNPIIHSIHCGQHYTRQHHQHHQRKL